MNNIMKELNKIEYGWIDKNNNKYNEVNNLFSENYVLQSPEQVIKNKIGICWDQVELIGLNTHGNCLKEYMNLILN